MKILTLYLIIGLAFHGFSQERFSFYIEVPDIKYVPITTHNNNGKRIAYSNTGNSNLDAMINSYQIFNSEEVFKNSPEPSLQNIFIVVCNDLELMNQFYLNYNQFYPRVEQIKIELFSEPNDLGMNGGYTGTDQEELKYIRAPEAWDITTGSSDIVIGIADTNFQYNHEDLAGKLSVVVNSSSNDFSGNQHGSSVASIAAANTNNNKGMAAIGYDSYIYAAAGYGTFRLDQLSQFSEVKVLNASWGSSSATPPSITPNAYNVMINQRGKVVIAAAGNGNNSGNTGPGYDPTRYYVPASYKDVISVSSIGHNHSYYDYGGILNYETFADYHQVKNNGQWVSHQHNDSIDIVAPGYGLVRVKGLNNYSDNDQGTSFAAPMVVGTVALMFDVNYCITPKEVETILKLTAIKIDNLPQNLPFYGKLGAGKLDAYEAVKMSKDMADAFGTVEVKNRILYRPWFYKLETAPYEIKMTNNDVSGGSKLKFRARNNIEILSGDYYPSTGGYIDLQIDGSLTLDCDPPPSIAARGFDQNERIKKRTNIHFEVLPTLVDEETEVHGYNLAEKSLFNIKIYNFFGIEVFSQLNIKTQKITLNLNSLTEGIYILKVYDVDGKILHTQKLVKK